MPSDRKHFSKTKPMELKHFDEAISWWYDRKPIEIDGAPKAKCYSASFLLNDQNCNLDLCGYPHEEEEVLSPMETIKNYQEKRATLNAEIDKVLSEIEARLKGGAEN